jgi:DNA-binding CsgD family transcriptional regulator
MDSSVLAREVEALGRGGLPPREFVAQASALVARRVDFDNYCFLAMDPETLLPSWAVRRCNSAIANFVPRIAELEVAELFEPSLAEHASRPVERALLRSAGSEGMFGQSPRCREILRSLDVKYEVQTFLRVQGMTWGRLRLHRRSRNPPFDPDEVALIDQMTTPFAVGLRRSLLRSIAEGAVLDDSPVVLVLSADLRVMSCADTAETLLAELQDAGVHDPERLPLSVRAVALRAIHPARSTVPATTRVRTRGGLWLTIRATSLDGGQRVAVMIERTPRSDVVSLVLAAHGLTPRESEVAAHVLLGLSTHDLSEVLGISEYTVQDHMKSIFDKTGVSSRKELAARLFAQCQPGPRAG